MEGRTGGKAVLMAGQVVGSGGPGSDKGGGGGSDGKEMQKGCLVQLCAWLRR